MDERPSSVDRLPTLTEVVELGPSVPQEAAAQPVAAENPADLPEAPFEPLAMPDLSGLAVAPLDLPLPEARAAADDAQALAREVLALLAPRIEAMFEGRLRETLAPALASAAEGLIRDSRTALTQTLQAMVEEAVARALHKPPEG
jgi:hypothetical protein